MSKSSLFLNLYPTQGWILMNLNIHKAHCLNIVPYKTTWKDRFWQINCFCNNCEMQYSGETSQGKFPGSFILTQADLVERGEIQPYQIYGCHYSPRRKAFKVCNRLIYHNRPWQILLYFVFWSYFIGLFWLLNNDLERTQNIQTYWIVFHRKISIWCISFITNLMKTCIEDLTFCVCVWIIQS